MEDLFGEVEVISSEDVEDCDPNLYAKRAEEALKKEKYNDAIIEIDKAIEYSGRNIEYIYQKVKILFAIGSYTECYRLIQTDIDDNFSSFSEKDKDQIYKYTAKCYRKCNISILPNQMIILTPEGDGMYSSIKEAIKSVKGNDKTIYLTEGTYYENLNINSKVYIEGYNASIVSNSQYGISFYNCTVYISNINIMNNSNMNNADIVSVYGGNITFTNCSITNEKVDGIYIGKKSKVILRNCSIKTGGISVALDSNSICNISKSIIESKSECAGICCRGKLIITNCNITANKGDKSKAIELDNSDGNQCNVKINESEISGSGYGIYSSKNTILDINNTTIHSSEIGIFLEGQMNIKSSTLNNNNSGIVINSGETKIIDCKIIKNIECGIYIYNSENTLISNCDINGNNIGLTIKNGSIRVEQSNISGNKQCGVYNTSKNSRILSSRIYDNGDTGIECSDNGKIEIDSSSIYCNKAPNVLVAEGGSIIAKNCNISSGSSFGVYSHKNGLCNLIECKIYKNAGKGLVTESNGVINNSNCSIYDNESLIGSLSGIRRFFKGI